MKKLLLPVILFALFSLACGLTSRTSTPAVQAAATAAPSAGPASAPAVLPTAVPTTAPTETPAVVATDAPTDAPTDASNPAPAEGGAPFPIVPPVDVNGNGKIDICEAIYRDTIQVLMGRLLVSDPQPFQDPAMGDGCAYDFGKDNRAAYFAYVAVGTEKMFTDALANAVRAEPVTTLGDSAFLNYGPDARQLWIRQGGKSILIAIGDEERVDVMTVFGFYLLDYIEKNP